MARGLFRHPPHSQPPRRFVQGGVAAAQNLTLDILDGASAIYAPTVLPQPVTVGALPLLDGASAIYAPTLTPTNTLTLALLDGASAIYAPTLAPQPVTEGPLPLLDGGSAIYALTIQPGAVTVGPLALLDGVSAIYSPTLAPQPVTVGALPLVDGASAIYTPTLTPKSTIALTLVAGTAYADTIIADSPVGYWRFGEPSGTNADDEIGSNDGTYSGAVTLGQASLLTGDADTSVLFGGGHVALGGQLISALSNASFECWYKGTDVSWWRALYSERAASGNDIWDIQTTQTDGYILFTHRDDAGTLSQPVGNVSVTDGFGHHVVVTKTGTAIAFYVDGQPAGTGTLTGTDTLTNAGLEAWIGADKGDGAVNLIGTVDEPAIYDYALTPAQVLAHFEAGTGTGGPAIYAPTLTPQNAIDLALLDGANALYAPTLIPQPVTGGPLALLDGGAAIYALTVSPVAVTVGELPLVDGGSAIYAPTLAPFSTLTLDLLDAGSAIYAPDIQPDQFVDLALLDGANAIYQPTLTVGSVTLGPLDLLESASAIYDLTIQSIVSGALPLLDGGSAIYDLTVQPAAVTVGLDLIDGGADIYAPTLTTGAVELSLPLLDSQADIYALTASQAGGGAQTVTLAFLQSLPELYSILVDQPGPRRRGGPSLPPMQPYMDSEDEEILIALLAT